MKKFRIVFIVFFALLISFQIDAQTKKANMSFKISQFDFGKIQESKGPVEVSFEFTNTGNEPIIIEKVEASCGCTTPTWSKAPVPRGGKGSIKAVFDPAGRPNTFDKTITVTSNSKNSPYVLRITGEVIPRGQTVEEAYKTQMGEIRLIKNHVSFGRMFETDVKTETIELINTSANPITLTLDQVPAHIKAEIVPGTLRGGQKGVLRITYNAKAKNDWGFVMDNFFVKINNKIDYNNRISSDATIEEDFSKLTPAQKEKAAKIKFVEMTHSFGTIKQGDIINYTFDFTNDGKSDLFIRKTTASCGCTAPVPTKGAIAPGQKGTIQVTFNSAGKSGDQNKTVTVYTNDPANPFVTLWIKGTVN